MRFVFNPSFKAVCWLFLSFLILYSCGDKGLEGRADDSFTISAEIPDFSDDMEFVWRIITQPEQSYLQIENLSGNSSAEMTFIPDVPGEYTFELSVYQYNDEISTESFEINILPRSQDLDPGDQEEEVLPAAESAVSELLTNDTDLQSVKWYDEEDEIEETRDTEILAADKQLKPKMIPIEKIVEAVKPVKIHKPVPGASIPFDKYRYTIQITSKNDLESAKAIAAALMETGYDAYIQKAVFKETNKTWYRVRIGSYANLETAKAVARSLSESRNERAWVDFVRYEN
ncbi:MAG: SPOR domain-containing protein [Candidatus Neomarinimicrobiota bacterium]